MDQRYYKATHIANIITPAIGFALSIPGLVALIVQAALNGEGLHVVTFSIYGCSLVISYAVFSLYHVFKYDARLGKLFKILDHATIYLLIAGTYTPFALGLLRGNWGWTLFATVWGVAVLGIVFKVFFIYRFKILGPLTYLVMGWLLVLVIKPAVTLIPVPGLLLLLAGGLFYSFGLIFYAWKRLRFHHAIWHLFVLAGSTCHYFAVYYHAIS
ncbi:hemolysin III [Malonomonas rubra DSM 5091]|uniref:Hemolysin III n=1 Tax=Malonomonas rubra DSM 5091 TaxID=1122189 RepID=A0A1M6N9Y6_MALRU|nr:hemolysin III family protein [Malonomonas rubra]SHJ92501.1 hemolysin III [Malonomonas rubra DSM 5091]